MIQNEHHGARSGKQFKELQNSSQIIINNYECLLT